MQRGVDPAQVAGRASRYQESDPSEVRGRQLLSENCVGLGARHVVQAVLGYLLDPRGDLQVSRWHDLRAIPEIDLVSVVLRRIVRCGDDNASYAVEMADAECHNGCRQWPWRDHGLEAGTGHDLRRVSGEDGGIVPSIKADDHVSASQAMINKVA